MSDNPKAAKAMVIDTALIAVLRMLVQALAAEFINNENVLKWILTALSIVESGFNENERLGKLADEIKRMVDEGRNPTDDEWKALEKEADVDYEAIMNWKPD